jgi:hypothetical protein
MSGGAFLYDESYMLQVAVELDALTAQKTENGKHIYDGQSRCAFEEVAEELRKVYRKVRAIDLFVSGDCSQVHFPVEGMQDIPDGYDLKLVSDLSDDDEVLVRQPDGS